MMLCDDALVLGPSGRVVRSAEVVRGAREYATFGVGVASGLWMYRTYYLVPYAAVDATGRRTPNSQRKNTG